MPGGSFTRMLDRFRIALLVPMEPEMRPLADALGLIPRRIGDLDLLVGASGSFEIVALTTSIGPAAAELATRRLLEAVEVDQLLVAGVAGGVDPSLDIGSVVVPAAVLDYSTGRGFTPSPFGALECRGLLLTTDGLVAPDELAAIDPPVTAVDMETAATARVCAERGVPWSVIRVISDHIGDGLVDASVFALGGSDGTVDPEALGRYLAAGPDAADRLTRIAADFETATSALANEVVTTLQRHR